MKTEKAEQNLAPFQYEPKIGPGDIIAPLKGGGVEVAH
jgi:hypothetical protein